VASEFLPSAARPADAGRLIADLLDTRRRTLAYAEVVSAGRWLGPKLAIVNPPLWEIGHLGWFQERWLLRRRGTAALAASSRPDADRLYDSSAVPHALRWELPLPDPETTLGWLAEVLERSIERVERGGGDPELAYYAELCILHEDMHNEAFAYTCQTHGYPAPRGLLSAPGARPARADCARADPAGSRGVAASDDDVALPEARFELGARPGSGFVFDNEKWAHPVRITAFRIARRPTTNGQFRAFVEDGGYRRGEWWSQAGRAWLAACGATAPRYWRRAERGWERRVFDRWVALDDALPVVHVNAHEAQAWCRWSGRSLPTEAQWEYAAAGTEGRRYPWGEAAPDPARANLYGAGAGQAPAGAHPHGDTPQGVRQLLGNVWEWTADPFRPYPGYVVDPYADYSRPWFGTHQVLRGGSFATAPRLTRNTWRNFYTPERNDIWAGFRSCAAGR
jgi:iron(II)-dependent oxidoreductase